MEIRHVNARHVRLRLNVFAGAAALTVAGLVAGCGGGGGGGGGGFPIALPTATAPVTGSGSGDSGIVASSTVAGLCAAPRTGINPATGTAYPDRSGTIDQEKTWVRSWIDETYLWYGEVPTTLKASDYATPIDWFAVLKTPLTTASGKARDRFHYTLGTEAYRLQSNAGVSVSYGIANAILKSSPPRDIRIAYVEPGSPAGMAGLQRGAKLLTVDGVDVVAATGTANINTINAALAPSAAGEKHTLVFEVGGTAQSPVTLTAQQVTRTPVQNVSTLTTPSGPVGYMLFNQHSVPAETQLINAFTTLKNAGVQDLVLDMRYNGGGLLDIASELAYMIAAPGPALTFERLSFNDKNPFPSLAAQQNRPFFSTTRGYGSGALPAGQALPTLGLSRVTVLAGPDTCSASESVINSLRGVGVTVHIVGGATCGKPYGFLPQDNCGTTYFAIQFKGVNQQGYGDYGDGFTPTCTVADDFGHALGDAAEARLAAALTLRSTNACPAGTTSMKAAVNALQKSSTPDASDVELPYLQRSPLEEMRLLDSPANPG